MTDDNYFPQFITQQLFCIESDLQGHCIQGVRTQSISQVMTAASHFYYDVVLYGRAIPNGVMQLYRNLSKVISHKKRGGQNLDEQK